MRIRVHLSSFFLYENHSRKSRWMRQCLQTHSEKLIWCSLNCIHPQKYSKTANRHQPIFKELSRHFYLWFVDLMYIGKGKVLVCLSCAPLIYELLNHKWRHLASSSRTVCFTSNAFWQDESRHGLILTENIVKVALFLNVFSLIRPEYNIIFLGEKKSLETIQILKANFRR